MLRFIRWCFLSLFVCVSCLEPFAPPATSERLDALVVDGFIDSGGSVSVKLSRTIPLNQTGLTPKESGAIITIESSSLEIFPLDEQEPGTYTASDLVVSTSATYMLRIQTAGGDAYSSDEVKIYTTPPIDSIYFTVAGSGNDLEIRTDSRDPNSNATGYYLTECIETYEYHAPVYSGYKFVNKQPIGRNPDEQIYTCWRDELTPIIITSTNNLSDHIISGQRVAIVSKNSPKISVRYSILVQQRSISEEEYVYRGQLLKSTEQQGNLFAVIPGAVVSNVHSNENPDEPVLGYFRGQQQVQRRYFIEWNMLPNDFQVSISSNCQPEPTCRSDSPPSTTGPDQCIEIAQLGDDAIITTVVNDARGNPITYYFVNAACGDCRIKGGSTTRPLFW